MSTSTKKRSKAAAAMIPAPPVQVAFHSSLDALEKVVSVAVRGDQPDTTLLKQVDYYLATLQDGADLVNVVLYQHNVTKLLEMMKGISILHSSLLDETTLKDAVKNDKDYAVKLLRALYKESGATIAFMDSKGSKLFDTDGLKKSPMLTQTTDSAEVTKKVMKLPSSKREELRGIVSKLLKYNDRDKQPTRASNKRRSPKPVTEVETVAGATVAA